MLYRRLEHQYVWLFDPRLHAHRLRDPGPYKVRDTGISRVKTLASLMQVWWLLRILAVAAMNEFLSHQLEELRHPRGELSRAPGDRLAQRRYHEPRVLRAGTKRTQAKQPSPGERVRTCTA